MRKCTIVLLLVAVVLTIGGCTWLKDIWPSKQRMKADPVSLYHAGVEAYNEGRYSKAIEYFTRVKERFPLHELALLAELGIADAYYSDKDYASAELAYTDFLNLHPTHEHIPYVIYQIGMCHYMNMLSIDRDQTETIRAMKEFEQVIARFPTSKFAFLAEEKLRDCKKRLAAKEFYVGQFYFKHGKYLAAIRRFEYLLANYPNLGYDYQTKVFLEEAKKRLATETASTPSLIDEGRMNTGPLP